MKSWIPLIIILSLFLAASYLAQEYAETIRSYLTSKGNLAAVIIYISIAISSIVIAPIASSPLVPVASVVWGNFWAAIFTIIGWASGSILAFLVARKYGLPLARKFISIKSLEQIEKILPKKEHKMFLSILVLRMALPVDVLSYALGIFSPIKFKTYTAATILGVMPGAFIISYLGNLPFRYQVIILIIGSISAVIIDAIWHKFKKTP